MSSGLLRRVHDGIVIVTKAAYTYDSGSNVVRVRLYSGGQWTTLVDSIIYAPFGDAESWKLGNGVWCHVGLDSSYRVDSISTSPDTLARISYSLDAEGNITGITNWLDTSANRRFAYDDIGRLIAASSVDYPDTLQKYIYSHNGNRDTVISYGDSAVDTTVYIYSGNKLIQISGPDSAFFSYDSLGNIIREVRGGDTTTFQYNDAGMLIAVDSGATGTYSYDARYRRIMRVTGDGAVTKYVPDESGQILTEYAVTSGWDRDYIYLNGQLVARVSSQAGEGIQYVINDHLGTPLALADENRTIRWKGKWYPFGEIYDEFVSTDNKTRFPGQVEDDETGLYYNWHRYYNPRTGRYFQADPIGLDGGDYNIYRYAYGNPLSYTDPDGRIPLALLLLGAYKIGSIIYDIWTTGQTLFDDCATMEEKSVVAGLFVAGLISSKGGLPKLGKELVRGQVHHAISKKIFRQLERHSILKGVYKFRDKRFITRAVNLPAHYGYQSWHRALDDEISMWIKNHRSTTRKTFEKYINWRYSQPDLIERFPGGFK